MDKLQSALKSVIEKLDGFDLSEPLTGEKLGEYKNLVGQAEALKSQIDMSNQAKAIKGWGNQSAGSAVAASFDRMALPDEGDIPGVTADAKSGEIYAIAGSYKGAKNVEHLKSAAYKDAFAEYIRGMGTKNAERAGRAMKVLNEGAWTQGEAWLPPDFRAELVKRMATVTSVRPNASVYTTGTNEVTFPQANYTSDDLYTSGVRFTWQGAGAQTSDITEATNPVSGQVKIPVHLATAAIILQRAQIEDNSFDVLGYISELGAEAYSLGEENAFTNGDGNGKPRGFLQHPAASIAQGATGTAAGVTYSGDYVGTGSSDLAWGTAAAGTGLFGVEAALPPQYENGAKWYAAKNTYSRIRAINAGTATLPQWSLGDSWPNLGNNYQPMLLGYATARNQFMPTYTAGTAKTIAALGEMKGYFIIDRVGLSVEVNPYILGLRDQVVVYMRKRVGGDLVRYWMMKFLGYTA
jgi:HK97 family phage major capsid protein